jgi:transposase InsO family protein
LGDSQLVRFSKQCLNFQSQLICGKHTAGFCRGGQTIAELNEGVKQNIERVHNKVLLMIGTNDFLQHRSPEQIISDYKILIETLFKAKKDILVVTVLPIPKLALNDVDHFKKLDKVNRFINSLACIQGVKVIDATNQFINSNDESLCRLSLYEKDIFLNQRKVQDLIHLNRNGFIVLKKVIDESLVRNVGGGQELNSFIGLKKINDIFCHDDLSNELLDENNFHERPIETVSNFLPIMDVCIGNIKNKCIIDSGSQATIISEQFYNTVKDSVDYRIPELPVSNTTIVGVTGNKSKRIEKQVQFDITVNELTMTIECLVVKGIHIDLLLGCDFLTKHNAIIDFKEKRLNLIYSNKYYSIGLRQNSNDSMVGSINVIQVNYVDNLIYEHTDEISGHFNEMNHEKTVELNSQLNEVRNIMLNNESELRPDHSSPVDIDEIIDRKVQDISTGSEVNSVGDLEKLKWVLKKNKNVFSDKPGCIKNYVAKLNLKVDRPYIGKSYPVPYHKRKAVEEELNKLKEMDVIEISDSSFSNPLVCVVKKDLSIRTCLDSRKLNSFLKPDRQSTETTEEILQKFMNVKYFTALDLTMGFHQVLLDKDSRQYVAFTFAGKNYQYKRLPFGLNVSTALFTKAMDTIFGPKFSEFVTCYVDDILITSKSYEEHIEHLDRVLSRLQECGATVKIAKTEFLKKEVKFLGYILSDQGITMDPEKVSKIQNFPEPNNLKKLQGFLGLCNYYRAFQQNYSYLTAKFNHLLSNKSKWTWGERERNIFKEIKDKFLESVLLNHPNWSKPFFINTDASDISVAAILYQYNEVGEEKVVCFASRTLVNAEKGYSTTEKELLAVVFACKKFRSYIIGHFKVVVRSDHRALSFLRTCKLTNGRLLRWSLVLQEYNLEIEYVKGKNNIPADILSRTTDSEYQTNRDMNTIQVLKTNVKWGVENKEFNKLFKTIGEQQRTDERLNVILHRLESNEESRVKDNFMIHNGILFQKKKGNNEKFRVCIPDGIKSKLIELSHLKYGHMGGNKIYLCLKEFCVFPAMEKTIKTQLKKCVLCQKAKHVTVKQIGNLRPIVPERVRELVSVDLIGELPTGVGGVKYIFVLVDVFSKFVKLYPIKRATTKTLLSKIFDKYIPEVGPIEAILSDHGTQFTSDMWYSKLEESNIKAVHTSVYHPQSNPTERVNKEVNKIIRIYCHKKHTNWPAVLEFVEQCLNNSVHGITEHVPSEVMLGKVNKHFLESVIEFPQNRQLDHPKCIQLVREKLRSKAEKRKVKFDNKIRPVSFEIGDKVLIKTHHLSNKLNKKIKKFFLLFAGPYEIIEIKMDNAYVVKNTATDEIVGTYNVTQLKKFIQ